MFKDNRLTQLLGLELPVLQGGMVWCSGWRLASAVSNGGGLGVLGSGSMPGHVFGEHLQAMRAATERPWGVNIPLMWSHSEEVFTQCEVAGVPVLITSAGSPSRLTERAHRAGMRVGHVVSNPRFARKAEDAGVDFIIAEGTEAGGHNGVEELTTLVLLQLVAKEVSCPIVSAGGYHDGRGLAAAIALGADGIQMGSRFAVSEESSASPAYKRHMLGITAQDTTIISRAWSPTRVARNDFSNQLLEIEATGGSLEAQKNFRREGKSRQGIFDGDLHGGELEIGQIAATFTHIPRVDDILHELVDTYREAATRLRQQGGAEE